MCKRKENFENYDKYDCFSFRFNDFMYLYSVEKKTKATWRIQEKRVFMIVYQVYLMLNCLRISCSLLYYMLSKGMSI